MRETKFRGRNIKNGAWIYGFFVHDEEWAKSYIYYVSQPGKGAFYQLTRSEVDEKTVGQFIGLKDKNGKEIYAGDIVKVTSNLGADWVHIGIIEYDDGYYYARCEGHHPTFKGPAYIFEVIGNVCENPNLVPVEVKT